MSEMSESYLKFLLARRDWELAKARLTSVFDLMCGNLSGSEAEEVRKDLEYFVEEFGGKLGVE